MFLPPAQDWNLAKRWKIRFRSGKRLIAWIPVLLMTVHSVFMCELKKGTGNDAELFRLRLRSSGRSVRETWERGQSGGGHSMVHLAEEELDLWLNLADFWISSSLLGTEDLGIKVSCSVQHGGECLMAIIDSGLRNWCLYWISEVMCWAVREEQTVSALPLTSGFSHKTSNCKALSLNGSNCLGQLGWCSAGEFVCLSREKLFWGEKGKTKQNLKPFKSVLCQRHYWKVQ